MKKDAVTKIAELGADEYQVSGEARRQAQEEQQTEKSETQWNYIPKNQSCVHPIKHDKGDLTVKNFEKYLTLTFDYIEQIFLFSLFFFFFFFWEIKKLELKS